MDPGEVGFQHPWFMVQHVVGQRNLWPRYIVLKVFCNYLGFKDLKILAAFFLGNHVGCDLAVRLLYRVNSHFGEIKRRTFVNYYNWLIGSREFRRGVTYYDVRRRRVCNMDGRVMGDNIPVGVGVRGLGIGGRRRNINMRGLDPFCINELLGIVVFL
jgi:hypothetical protein